MALIDVFKFDNTKFTALAADKRNAVLKGIAYRAGMLDSNGDIDASDLAAIKLWIRTKMKDYVRTAALDAQDYERDRSATPVDPDAQEVLWSLHHRKLI